MKFALCETTFVCDLVSVTKPFVEMSRNVM